MEEFVIKSRSDLLRHKSKILKEIKSSGSELKTNFKYSFSPKIKTASGTKIDYNKIIKFIIVGYKSFLWIKRVRTFFNNKKNKRRS